MQANLQPNQSQNQHQKRLEQRQKSKARPYMLDISPVSNQNTSITPQNLNISLNQSIEKTSAAQNLKTYNQRSKSRTAQNQKLQANTSYSNKSAQSFSNKLNEPQSALNSSRPIVTPKGYDEQTNLTSRNNNEKLQPFNKKKQNISPPKIIHSSTTNKNTQSSQYSNFILNNKQFPTKIDSLSLLNPYNPIQQNKQTPTQKEFSPSKMDPAQSYQDQTPTHPYQETLNSSLHNDSTHQFSSSGGYSLNNSKVENRLLQYAKVYENRRSKQIEFKSIKEREPSKEKPDINASSANVVEQKKQQIFEQIFKTINTSTDSSAQKGQKSQFVDPATANFRNLPIQVLDILMDVFVEFEEGQRPWNIEKFVQKCNEVYSKIPLGDRNELIKIYNPKNQLKEKEKLKQRTNSKNKNKVSIIYTHMVQSNTFQPEINQNSAQMCMNMRMYGVNPGETLYTLFEKKQRKMEQLKDEIEREQFKECTFKPSTIAEADKHKPSKSFYAKLELQNESVNSLRKNQSPTKGYHRTKK